jgi:hypothetical protein
MAGSSSAARMAMMAMRQRKVEDQLTLPAITRKLNY